MVQSCHLCPYLKSCIVASLGEDDREKFSASLLRYTIKGKGRAVVNAGEGVTGVYFLCEGLVKLTRTLESGEETVVDILDPFSLIGDFPGKEVNRQTFSALPITETVEVTYIKSEDFLSVMNSVPRFAGAVAFHMAQKLLRSRRSLAMMGCPVEQRVLMMMARLIARMKKKGACKSFLIDLSRRDLAQLIQTAPETLSRTLRSLQEKGVIQLQKEGIRVVTEDILKKHYEDFCEHGWI